MDHSQYGWYKSRNRIGRLSDGIPKKRVDKDRLPIRKRKIIDQIKDDNAYPADKEVWE